MFGLLMLLVYSTFFLQRGDYLIVGVHGDSLVNRVKGMNLPLMNLQERVLGVLGCRYVNDVLVDAPYTISNELIKELGITEVICARPSFLKCSLSEADETRYDDATKAGILQLLLVDSDFRIENVIHRIQRNHEAFQARFERKTQAEREHFAQNGPK
jgi:ethanolamine-phosphate cytidylyltransferase